MSHYDAQRKERLGRFTCSQGHALFFRPDQYDRRTFLARSLTRTALWSLDVLFGTFAALRSLGRRETGDSPYAYDMTETRDGQTRTLAYDSMDGGPGRAWKEGSQGLCVMAGGVDASPSMFRPYCDELANTLPGLDFYTPYLRTSQSTCAETMACEVYEVVRAYLGRNPHRPVCLIGFSYGAFVLAHVDLKLLQFQPGASVSFTAIAGLFYGTAVFDRIDAVGAGSFASRAPLVRKEYTHGNERSVAFLEEWRGTAPTSPRAYHFYASLDDEMIAPVETALPLLYHEEVHHTVAGATHHGLLASAREGVLRQTYAYFGRVF